MWVSYFNSTRNVSLSSELWWGMWVSCLNLGEECESLFVWTVVRDAILSSQQHEECKSLVCTVVRNARLNSMRNVSPLSELWWWIWVFHLYCGDECESLVSTACDKKCESSSQILVMRNVSPRLDCMWWGMWVLVSNTCDEECESSSQILVMRNVSPRLNYLWWGMWVLVSTTCDEECESSSQLLVMRNVSPCARTVGSALISPLPLGT